MGEVYYLGDNAFTMNKLKRSIAHDTSINKDGMYDDAIMKQKNLFRSFMDDVLGRSEAVEDELAA